MANIIISPSKYVQGKGELANIAQYATKLGKKPFILISEGGKKRVGGISADSFKRMRSGNRCRWRKDF